MLCTGGREKLVASEGLVSMLRSKKNKDSCCLGYNSLETISTLFPSPFLGLGSIAVSA